jgi:hypothetical protein
MYLPKIMQVTHCKLQIFCILDHNIYLLFYKKTQSIITKILNISFICIGVFIQYIIIIVFICPQVLCVVLFRTSESGELYDWAILNDKLYWPVWARELGAILQLLPVLVVPLVAMVQTCRYLSNGPPDLFDVSISSTLT